MRSLANCYAQDPTRGVEATELASCVHLARGGDLRGAVARARFAVGQVADRPPWDALGEVLAERLLEQDDEPWAALALLDHTEGPTHLSGKVRDDALEERWLTNDGLDALEALVFARADERADAGWTALSALLAARDSGQTFDEQLVLRASRRQDDDNARAWGVELLVLLSLDHDEAAQGLAAQALDAFADRPRALLEILDTMNMDEELGPFLHAVSLHEPEWISGRTIATPHRETGADGHNTRSLVHALASVMGASPVTLEGGLILPEGPRRTDAEWRETKASGDKAFTDWLRTCVSVVLALVGLALGLYQLLR